MHERALGRTDLRLSEISLGTWGLAAQSYGTVSDDDFERTVRGAIEAGITTFDMAPLWGDGRAERIVAEATRGERDRVNFITRVGAVREGGEVVHRLDRDSVVEACEASLERLGTDCVDLLLLHNPPSDTWAEQAWREGIEKLRADGKIRAWGASVGNAEAGRHAVASGAEAICIPYNLLGGDDLHDLGDEISVAGCGVLACSPLGYGLLAGRWGEAHRFGEQDHRARRWRAAVLRQRVRQADLMRFLVHDAVPSLANAALRYVLSNAVVTSAVVGARTVEQAEEAAAAADGPPYLPEEDLLRIPQVLAATGV